MRRAECVMGALLAVLWSAPLGAQQASGTVRGRVSDDATHQPLSGVSVAVGGRGALTQADGRYVVTGVPAGTDTLRTRMIGYAPAIAAFGLGFALWRTHAAVQEATVEELVPQAAPTPIPLPLEALPTPARTDCGRAVPLFASLNSMVEDAAFSESELTLIKHWGDSLQILRLEAAGSHSNCHGWIFTGGRHRVKCEDVPAILEDNEYQRVDAPQAQDLVIYFGPRGEVLHSGLVHSAAPSGRILIESKWGSLGVFLHPLTAQPYGTTYAFYHSHRAGHRLLGLGE